MQEKKQEMIRECQDIREQIGEIAADLQDCWTDRAGREMIRNLQKVIESMDQTIERMYEL